LCERPTWVFLLAQLSKNYESLQLTRLWVIQLYLYSQTCRRST